MTTKLNVLDNITSIFKVDTATGVTTNLPLILSNTTQSTSATTGSLVIAGGVGISGALYAGSFDAGTINVDDLSITSLTNTGLSVLQGTVNITNTTASTNTASGALTVSGGIGVSNDSVMSKLRIESNAINAFSVARESNGPVIFEINSTQPSISIYNPSTNSSPFMTQNYIFKNSANTDINGIRYYRQLTDNIPDLESAYEYVDIYHEGSPQRVYELFGNVINFIPDVILYSLTNSTSTSTGALKVIGGVGIQGDLYSGSLNTSNAVITSLTNTGTSTMEGVVSITNTTGSTGTTTGALTVAGGVGVAGAINSASLTTGATSITSLTNTGTSSLAGAVSVTNTTASTNTSSGALTVAGGLGVAGAINSGSLSSGATSITSLTNTGTSSLAGVVSVTNTSASTNTSSGAITVSGGLGVAGTVNSGSLSSGATSITSLTNTGTSTLQGAVSITNTTASTNMSTGALVVSGGLGVTGNATINNVRIPTNNVLELGFNVAGKEENAGKIGYQLFSATDVDIVGAGTSSGIRSVRLWDYAIAAEGFRLAQLKQFEFGFGTPGKQTDAGKISYGDFGFADALSIVGAGTGTSRQLMLWDNVRVRNNLVIQSAFTTTGSTSTSTGALTVAGGVGITGAMFSGSVSTGTANITTNIASTSATTGSLIVAGGIGAAGAINSGGGMTSYNTTASTSTTTGSLIVAGGVGVAGSVFATSLNSTNAVITNATTTSLSSTSLTVVGTQASTNTTTGSLIVAGGMAIQSTQDVVSSSNGGSLTIAGGVAVAKSMIIGNTLTISGDLIVNGTTTTVNSTTVSISDNALVLNAGPVNSGNDSGIINQRYQIANDAGTGDVVSGGELPVETYALVTATSNTIVLPTTASASDSTYNNWWIKITTGSGQNQVRFINTYTGSTRTANLATSFTTTPTVGDTVELYNRSYSTFIWKEGQKRFITGFTTFNNSGTAQIVDYADLSTSTLTTESTIDSTSVSSGSIISKGGLGVAKNLSVGTALGLFSGSNFVKLKAPTTPTNITLTLPESYPVSGTSALLSDSSGNLYFSTSVSSSGSGLTSTFSSTVNNVSTPANITGLVFGNDLCFRIMLRVRINATTSLTELFELYGVYSPTSLWNMNYISKCGDVSGVAFSITTGGQLQYTSGNYSGFTSLEFKYEYLSF